MTNVLREGGARLYASLLAGSVILPQSFPPGVVASIVRTREKTQKEA